MLEARGPGRHRTLFYVHYANRARGARAKEKKLLESPGAEAPQKRRCSPSWARLISKVYHADPLTCRRCGGSLQIAAYNDDQFTIKKILECLGFSPPEVERPPPDIQYVPVDDDGREIETMVAEGPHFPQAHTRVFAASRGAKVCRRGRSPRPPRDSHPHRARVERR